MKKRTSYYIIIKIAFLFFWVFAVQYSYAQLQKIPLQAGKSKTSLLSSNHESTKINFTFEELNYINVETEKGTFTELIMPMGYSTGEVGTPKLPAAKKLIEIPFGAKVSINITEYTTEEYKLSDFEAKFPVMPVQPSLRRDQNIKDVKFEYDPEYYTKKSYIEPELADIEVLGVMRGMRIGRITVAPVHYNPDKETIKVYNNIKVEIEYESSETELANYIKASTYSPYFDVVYNSVINPLESGDIFDDYPDLTKHPVKMVVVSHPDFQETIQPFIEWKTIQGFNIIEAYTDDIGSTSSDIKSYIHAQYNAGTPEDPAPTFVVLVGDTDKIPASATGSKTKVVTDLYYASVDGDYFPDMYLGRLSARNEQELKNQIDKILYYQKYEFEDPSYLNDATLIAGTDSDWNPRIGQPTVQYATENYFNLSNGFNNVNDYLTSYSGCYDEERISVSLINYTAHCNSTSWSDPTLTASSVRNLTNTGKYPLAVGNCCLSALFSHSESIGEAWVRAEKGGAVAYIGSAPNTHWFEDFYWSVGAFPIEGNNDGYVPSTEETTLGVYDSYFTSEYNAVAATKFVGNLAITEAHLQGYNTHSNTEYYWEAYHTLGDPSTMIYFTEGNNNDVSYMDFIPANANEFAVNALPGSYVALSADNVLHGAAFVDGSGSVNVPIEPFPAGSLVTIVVTKPQHIPYINNEIPVLEAEGPYIIVDKYEINDQQGNDNGIIDYGETISLNITAKNIGNENATDISGIISVDDQYYTITDDVASFDNIDAGEQVTKENAFTIEIANNIPDQHTKSFDVVFSDNENQWVSNIILTANAPLLEFEDFFVDNNNSISDLYPGETADINVTLTNTGHSLSKNIDVMLQSSSPWITINTDIPLEIGPLHPDESQQIAFNITSSEETPLEESAELLFIANTGEYEFNYEKSIIIGTLPFFLMGDSITIEACAGRFYDSGGPENNYSNDEDVIMTFVPSKPDHVLEFEFTNFDVEHHEECDWDRLKIYNGLDTLAELIGVYCGINSPGKVIAANEDGALTFHFISDNSVTKQGWEAVFECVDVSQPPLCAENPYPKNRAINTTFDKEKPIIEWNKVNEAFAYDVYIDKKALPTNKTAAVFNNFYNPHIESYEKYVWKIVPYNTAGHAENCPEWYFLTGEITDKIIVSDDDINTCNAMFYDSGGADNNYSNKEDYTITIHPATGNGQIMADFQSFEVEASDGCIYDRLKIYNGIDTDANLIGTYCGTESPGTIIADNEHGALTFRFISDASVTLPGWSAKVSCVFDHDVYSASFDVKDENNNIIYYPTIFINEKEYKPGQYEIKYLSAEHYNYRVKKEGYKDEEGDFYVVNKDIELSVIMQEDLTNIVKPQGTSASGLQIYPNPAISVINAVIDINADKLTFTLMNYQGQLLETRRLRNPSGETTEQFNLNPYPSGIYYLKAKAGHEVYIQKIVLQ